MFTVVRVNYTVKVSAKYFQRFFNQKSSAFDYFFGIKTIDSKTVYSSKSGPTSGI